MDDNSYLPPRQLTTAGIANTINNFSYYKKNEKAHERYIPTCMCAGFTEEQNAKKSGIDPGTQLNNQLCKTLV